MQVQVRFLENLRLEASFDDFTVITDQPIRYKGDGTAPGPFDLFLASSALCAGYFVKVYCMARDIPTHDIRITQDNLVHPKNRYQQTFKITVELPDTLSEKHQKGIVDSMERCTVKRVVQNGPTFEIETRTSGSASSGLEYEKKSTTTMLSGKDCPLEETLHQMTQKIESMGIKLEIASWRNNLPHVWSVHIRDADSPLCFTNGKGATQDAALCSALGEFFERLGTNFFYNDYYLGETISHKPFVHFPDEKWFTPQKDGALPQGLMDETLLQAYNREGNLKSHHLIDSNSAAAPRGICALPFKRQSDNATVYIPVGLIGNLFVSNGMSAGNSLYEARTQALSEIFERAVKKQIILEEITLPDVPPSFLEKFPSILEGIKKLEAQGFPVLVKDASLGGKYPVMCVAIMNPRTGGVFASFGAHPQFAVALERSLTELMQGRSFEGLNDVPAPTFNTCAIKEPHNIVEHFIDSSGVLSWKFFSRQADYAFCPWDFQGSTEEEFHYLMRILQKLKKEVYIADDSSLGVSTCRIIVPQYSEIYEPEDLIWDNSNKALVFRSDILNLHVLDESQLLSLIEKLEESELDDYTPIGELIGVAFEENSPWGKCTILELKALIHLALKNYSAAKEAVELFLQFNDNLPQRRTFYQVVDIVLELTLREDLLLDDYFPSLTRMYGTEMLDHAMGSVSGEIRFFGLTPTDMNLKGLEKHLKLLESYQKLQAARAAHCPVED